MLKELPVTGNAEDNLQDKSVLNVRDIIIRRNCTHRRHPAHGGTADRKKNTAIAAEGLRNSWGANIGSTLLQTSQDWETQARASPPPGLTPG